MSVAETVVGAVIVVVVAIPSYTLKPQTPFDSRSTSAPLFDSATALVVIDLQQVEPSAIKALQPKTVEC